MSSGRARGWPRHETPGARTTKQARPLRSQARARGSRRDDGAVAMAEAEAARVRADAALGRVMNELAPALRPASIVSWKGRDYGSKGVHAARLSTSRQRPHAKNFGLTLPALGRVGSLAGSESSRQYQGADVTSPARGAAVASSARGGAAVVSPACRERLSSRQRAGDLLSSRRRGGERLLPLRLSEEDRLRPLRLSEGGSCLAGSQRSGSGHVGSPKKSDGLFGARESDSGLVGVRETGSDRP